MKPLFVAERSIGKLPAQIFQDAGFGIEILGNDRIWCASKRWRNSYHKSGKLRLRDTIKFNSEWPLTKELTLEEIIRKKDVEIAY